MDFRAILVPESLLAKIGNFFLDIEIANCKIVQLTGQGLDFFPHAGADFKHLGIGIVVQLPDIERACTLVADFYFNKFRSAALENTSIRDGRTEWNRA